MTPSLLYPLPTSLHSSSRPRRQNRMRLDIILLGLDIITFQLDRAKPPASIRWPLPLLTANSHSQRGIAHGRPVLPQTANEHVRRCPAHRQTSPRCMTPPLLGPRTLHFPNSRSMHFFFFVFDCILDGCRSELESMENPSHAHQAMHLHLWPPVLACGMPLGLVYSEAKIHCIYPTSKPI